MSIRYFEADVLNPVGVGIKVIVNVCNDKGSWGRGFMSKISQKWVNPELVYRRMKDKSLGKVLFARVGFNVFVANIIGQVTNAWYGAPIRYDAVATALDSIGEWAEQQEASLHIPRLGCGLEEAGAEWDQILPIIESKILSRGIHVYVYDPIKDTTSEEN